MRYRLMEQSYFTLVRLLREHRVSQRAVYEHAMLRAE